MKFGLTFAIKPPHVSKSQVFTTFELLHDDLKRHLSDKTKANEVRNEIQHLATSYVNSFKPSMNDLKKHKILKRLKHNKDIIILRPDKGNGVVVLDKVVYNKAMVDLLSDNSKFKKLESDLTLRREGQLQRFLRKLKKNGLLDCNIYREIYPTGSQPARLYGLPKLHKVKDPKTITPPFRPIVSSIGTYNYNLVKYLCSLLKPHISSEFCATDTFCFVQEIQQFDFSDKFLVSYDVSSLFTNVPLSETIDLTVNAIIDGNMNPDLKLSKVHLKQLFNFATSHTHFLFNGCFYDQIDGVAMGSPLAPVLANFFMGHYERLCLEKYTGTQVLYYRRYVDDIICCFQNSHDADMCFQYLNKCHPNIKFTMETETDGKLPFLDVLLSRQRSSNNECSCITSVFRKKTYTGLLTNYFSFTPFQCKLGLIKTLIDRAYKINNSTQGFQNDINTLTTILKRNMFPSWLIDKSNQGYLRNVTTKEAPKHDVSNYHFYKLPYIGFYSSYTRKKISSIINKYCKDLNVKVIFSPFRILSNHVLYTNLLVRAVVLATLVKPTGISTHV